MFEYKFRSPQGRLGLLLKPLLAGFMGTLHISLAFSHIELLTSLRMYLFYNVLGEDECTFWGGNVQTINWSLTKYRLNNHKGLWEPNIIYYNKIYYNGSSLSNVPKYTAV